MVDVSGLTWAVTIGLIVVLLAVDLILASLRPHRVGFAEAGAWSVFYVLGAVGFGVWFTLGHGGELGTEYFAGYLVEKSLSVDNLFVFVIIMTTFSVPERHQHKVLTFGIILALVMRGIFIALGATLLSLFSFVFLLFGLLARLVYLSSGLAFILAFIGVKLILHWAHVDIEESVPQIPTPVSLTVILGALALVTVASLVKTRRDPTAVAHAGSLRAHSTAPRRSRAPTDDTTTDPAA